MLNDSVIPATIGQPYRPIPLDSRLNIIGDIIYTIKDDIQNELGLLDEHIEIRIRNASPIMEYNTDGHILMMAINSKDDLGYYMIFMHPNECMKVLEHCRLKTFIYKMVHSIAHEFRHIYQFKNNTYNVMSIEDKEYQTNHDNIDYEVDANTFASNYMASRSEAIWNICVSIIEERFKQQSLLAFNFDFCGFILYINRECKVLHDSLLSMFSLANIEGNVTFLPQYGANGHRHAIEIINGNVILYYDPVLYTNDINLADLNTICEQVALLYNVGCDIIYSRCINPDYKCIGSKDKYFIDPVIPYIKTALYEYLAVTVY